MTNETPKRKAVNFDLYTHALRRYYNYESYTRAYYEISKFMKEHGFEHRQGSGYFSIEEMTDSEIFAVMSELKDKCPFVKSCTKVIDVTDIGVQHDLTEFVKESYSQPQKEQSQILRKDLIEQQKQCGGYTPPVTPVNQEQPAPEQTQKLTPPRASISRIRTAMR